MKENPIDFFSSALKFGIKPGLLRIEKLMDALGNPEKALKIIHVAGTNGKGSTCTMIAKALESSGLKTGLFLSPYIKSFGERIQINGEYIKDEKIEYLGGKIKNAIQALKSQGVEDPTEFELVTALAFLHYSEEKCDYVVLETGLGGRFDATNIIKNPILSVITQISFDHEKILGDTIEKIAFEKAGIIKENTPVVIYPELEGDARQVILKAAKEKNASVLIPEIPLLLETSIDGTTLSLGGEEYKLSLLGKHQALNASVAITALKELRKTEKRITSTAICEGLSKSFIPGRFQVISGNPLIILDGAHNESAIDRLAENIEAYIKGKNLCIIMGMMKDKNYEVCVKKMAERATCFYAVAPKGERSLPPAECAGIAKKYCENVTSFEASKDALESAVLSIKQDDALIICGSLYLISEILPFFDKTSLED